MADQQELWQRIAQLADQSTQAQARLTAQWNEIITKALQRLGASAESLSNAAPTPESLRALYDKWVNIAESTYAEAAHAPQFAQAQAELGNAQSKLRTAQREFIERMAREFDLPTRAELNSLHEQLRDLKKAMQELKKRAARSSGPAGS
jgi:class III poly(R)-hydroxyalkanoic acid synthase PhaE subunit